MPVVLYKAIMPALGDVVLSEGEGGLKQFPALRL